jgi:hypothetical protein
MCVMARITVPLHPLTQVITYILIMQQVGPRAAGAWSRAFWAPTSSWRRTASSRPSPRRGRCREDCGSVWLCCVLRATLALRCPLKRCVKVGSLAFQLCCVLCLSVMLWCGSCADVGISCSQFCLVHPIQAVACLKPAVPAVAATHFSCTYLPSVCTLSCAQGGHRRHEGAGARPHGNLFGGRRPQDRRDHLRRLRADAEQARGNGVSACDRVAVVFVRVGSACGLMCRG